MPKKFTDDTLSSLVKTMVNDAESDNDDRSVARIDAMEYYDGNMKDTPSEEGRSKVISRDTRSSIKKILPSIVRTILGNDEVVEFMPQGEGDDEYASQASDYINYIVLPECEGEAAIEDAIHDALLLRSGVLTWWYDEKTEIEVSNHSGLNEQAFAQLVSDEDVTPLEHTERLDTVEIEGQGPQEVPVHDVKVRRRIKANKLCAAAVPADEFLIYSDAISVAESPLTGRRTKLRKSDLVAMGYDPKRVKMMKTSDGDDSNEESERLKRSRGLSSDEGDRDDNSPDWTMHEVDYYELYVRVDYDGDGIAELRRIDYAGSINADGLLLNEESDKAPYAILVCERRPHQWEGTSIADDTMEIQQIKTVLLRNTMDNIYAQNDMQPVYQEGAITDLDALFNPAFGKPISVRNGVSARDALNYNIVPFVAPATFEMLGYLDEELTDRTGISEASSGMAPDALQNMTAKASSMVEAAGIGQTELIVKTLAKGLAQFFKGLLHATIKHQDMPRTVRLRDQWVQVDPRQWNASMDVKINTGLGAGTRERDMLMMTMVTNVQEKLLAGLGPDNPFVKPDNVYNAISKLIEAAGLKTPSLYITEPDPEEVQAKLEAAQNQPDPEAQKAEAQMAIEKAKLEGSMQLKQLEMQANRDKEMAQMQADLEVEKAKLQSETEARRQELEADAVKAQLNAELEREKIAAEIQIKREEMQFQAEIEALKLEAQAKQAQGGGTPDISQIVEAIRQTANRSLIRDEFGEIVGSELRESVIN